MLKTEDVHVESSDTKSLLEILRLADHYLTLVFKNPANLNTIIKMIEGLKLPRLQRLISIPTAIKKMSHFEKSSSTVTANGNNSDSISPCSSCHNRSSPSDGCINTGFNSDLPLPIIETKENKWMGDNSTASGARPVPTVMKSSREAQLSNASELSMNECIINHNNTYTHTILINTSDNCKTSISATNGCAIDQCADYGSSIHRDEYHDQHLAAVDYSSSQVNDNGLASNISSIKTDVVIDDFDHNVDYDDELKSDVDTIVTSQGVDSGSVKQENQSVVSGNTFVSSIPSTYTMQDPLIVIMGVGEYDRDFHHSLAGVPKDYENIIQTFSIDKKWQYKVFYQLSDNNIVSVVYSNRKPELTKDSNKQYKLKWTREEMYMFAEQTRQKLVTNGHDGLVFFITGHGDKGKVLYDSKGKKCDLECIYATFVPESKEFLGYQEKTAETERLFHMPKIFLVDCCRGKNIAKVYQTNSNIKNKQDLNQAEKETKTTIADESKSEAVATHGHDGLETNETFAIKGINKDQAKQWMAQMTNFSKVYATIEGCAVMEGSEGGGIFLRNIVTVFKDKKFVLKHRWKDIIIKIREYTKRKGTQINNLLNATQIAEDESTLEKPVSFTSKYLPDINTINENFNFNQELEKECTITIANVSKKNKIAVRVETEQTRETRLHELERLTNANDVDENGDYTNKEFIESGFKIIDTFGDDKTFSRVWEEYFVTLFKLTNFKSKNAEIYERNIFHENYLYYTDSTNSPLVRMKDVAPICNAVVNQTHKVKFDEGLNEICTNCVFCDNNPENDGISSKMICYCQKCKHRLCEFCCHLLICQKTHLRLDIPQSIVTIEYTGGSTLEITCILSREWVTRIKNWLSSNTNIDNLTFEYQIKCIVSYKDNYDSHAPLTEKVTIQSYPDEQLVISRYNGYDNNYNDSDLYPKLKFDVPNSSQAIKVNVQMRTFDTVNKMYSLPTPFYQFPQSRSSQQTIVDSPTIVIANLSATEQIACLVETDPDINGQAGRKKIIEKLKNDTLEDENGNCKYESFVKNGYGLAHKFGDRIKFTKLWDKYYVTLFKLSKSSKVKNINEKNLVIYQRKMFYSNYLYYKDGHLHEFDTRDQDQSAEVDKPCIDVGKHDLQLCAFCENKTKQHFYWETCDYKAVLCHRCVDLIIRGKTVIGLNDNKAVKIKNIEQRAIKRLQIACNISQSWVEKAKRFLLTVNSAGNCSVPLKYEISLTIRDPEKLDAETKFRDIRKCFDFDVSTKREFRGNIPVNIFDEFKQAELECKVEIRILDVLNGIRSLPMHSMTTIKNIGIYQCQFTTLNSKGRFGPTSIGKEYDGKDNEYDTRLHDSKPGVQYWKVPLSGWWKIICHGAQGGDSKYHDYLRYGGKGATVGGLIKLYEDDIIQIVCGQMGESSDFKYYSRGGGGGGGTFFVLFKRGENNPDHDCNCQANNVVNTPLIVAAGGNGACQASGCTGIANGIDGLCDMSADRNDYGGYCMSSNGLAARGASFKYDFNIFQSVVDKTGNYNVCNGLSFMDGAIGGRRYLSRYGNGCDGGFGGGGGSRNDGGGGGGYIGGCASRFSNELLGALSCNACQNNSQRVMISGNNTGDGSIQVTYIRTV